MATRFQFCLSLPEGHGQPGDEKRFAPIIIALKALCDINVWHLENPGPDGPYPKLYESGVFYEQEKPGKEDWLDLPTLLKLGKGDCEDLACVRVAEIRFYEGIAAEPVIRWKWIPSDELRSQGYPEDKIPRDGIYLVHVMARYPDGTERVIECPSERLGMRGDY